MGDETTISTGENMLSSAEAAALAFIGFQERIEEIQAQLGQGQGEDNAVSLDTLISTTVRQLLLGEQRGEEHETTGLMQQIITQVANYLFNADENEISVLQAKIQEVLPKIITQMIQAEGDSTNPLKEMDKAVKTLLHANYIIERTILPTMQKNLEDLKGRISALESVKIEPESSTDGNRTSSSNKVKGCC